MLSPEEILQLEEKLCLSANAAWEMEEEGMTYSPVQKKVSVCIISKYVAVWEKHDVLI